MNISDDQIDKTWPDNGKSLYQTFETKDSEKNHCTNTKFTNHVNQWFNITLNTKLNLLPLVESSPDGYLGAIFIENRCLGKMNLRFKSFNMPPLIDKDGRDSNDNLCLMKPGRNFVAIKEIVFDETDNQVDDEDDGGLKKYKKALALLKESFDPTSKAPAICVHGQAEELFFGSSKVSSPDGWIVMVYINNYSHFIDLKPNFSVSFAAMMTKAGFQIDDYRVSL